MTTKRDQLFFDLFITAIEGGINYWGGVAKYKWQTADGADDILGFNAVVVDLEDDTEYVVDRAVIAKGFNKIAKAKGPFYDPNGANTQCADVKYLGPGLAKAVREAAFDPDEADFDAGDADTILQVGLFGEVVYG